MEIEDFLRWEQESRDTIDFKKIYVDIVEDVESGLMLSEIVYWHLPNKEGESRLRVQHEGFHWIAVRRYEWWDRTRLTPRQADRALKILVNKGIVVKDRFKFRGDPTIHVRINWEHFLGQLEFIAQNPITNPFLPNGEKELPAQISSHNSPNGENGITDPLIPVTETTTENTNKKEGSVLSHRASGLNRFQEQAASGEKPAVRVISENPKLKIGLHSDEMPRVGKCILRAIHATEMYQSQIEQLNDSVSFNGEHHPSLNEMHEKYGERFENYILSLPEVRQRHNTRLTVSAMIKQAQSYDHKFCGWFDYAEYHHGITQERSDDTPKVVPAGGYLKGSKSIEDLLK